MNTVLSNEKVKVWKKEGMKYLREVFKYSRTFNCTPKELFSLLCPTTEFDWIEGWHCEMIYSQSLYHEYNCIFRTDYFNMDEIWVISSFDKNKAIEFVRVSEHFTIKVDVKICDNLDNTVTGNWVLYITALTEEGNDILSSVDCEDDHVEVLIDALDYYINNNEMKSLPKGMFNFQA